MFFLPRRSEFFEFSTAFLLWAAVYPLIELMWRGYTHYTMALLGGICMLSLHFINMSFDAYSIFLRALLGALMITAWELLFGVVLNMALGLNVWDYSSHRFNLFGQICAPYTFFWFLLCFPAFFVSRYLHSIFDRLKGREENLQENISGISDSN